MTIDDIRKRKILVHSNYDPDNFGGIEAVVRKILAVAGEFSSNVSCFFGGDANSSYRKGAVTFTSRKILWRLSGASFLLFGNISFFMRALNARLVIFQEPYPTLWPAMFLVNYVLRKKIIVLVHANPVAKPWVMYLYDQLRAIVFNGAVCVTTSPNLSKKISSQYFFSVKVIPLSICTTRIELAKTLELPVRYALYVGRFSQYKGIAYIIEAAKLCPNIIFVIAGDGPLAPQIRNLVKNFDLRNVLLVNRFLTQLEKFELIERSEFVLFPSTSENEAFGLVQLEAMKFKKAIINTFLDSGVNFVAPHMICAVTVQKCNPIQLAEAAQLLWLDRFLAERLGEQGSRRLEEKFSEILFAEAWQELIADSVRE